MSTLKKLGEKYAKLINHLDQLRKGKETGESGQMDLSSSVFSKGYREDAKKWFNDLENFLKNDFQPSSTSYLIFKKTLKEKIGEEGQEYQTELNKLADFLYQQDDKRLSKLLTELAKEKKKKLRNYPFIFNK